MRTSRWGRERASWRWCPRSRFLGTACSGSGTSGICSAAAAAGAAVGGAAAARLNRLSWVCSLDDVWW